LSYRRALLAIARKDPTDGRSKRKGANRDAILRLLVSRVVSDWTREETEWLEQSYRSLPNLKADCENILRRAFRQVRGRVQDAMSFDKQRAA
jgi:hypothetical protein